MQQSRLAISFEPTFHDRVELEILVVEGDSVARLTSAKFQVSVQVPSEKAKALLDRAGDYILKAKIEGARGVRDGIAGKLVLETARGQTLEAEYWSPYPSDAATHLIDAALTLISSLSPSAEVSSFLGAIRSYFPHEGRGVAPVTPNTSLERTREG